MLEQVYQKALRAEEHFEHKAVLFIPSESYNAPVITVIQGLDDLSFDIYTLDKPNINSWFCNQVVSEVPEVDFVLSDFHWGTRWSLYDEHGLHDHLKVLIDGCDAGWMTWRQKYADYIHKHREKPPRDVVMQDLQPYRWIEPLGGYDPDVVFASQKKPGSSTYYLPFGIHREYLEHREGKSWDERSWDFAAVKGPGPKRQQLYEWLRLNDLPGKVFNGSSRGPWSCHPSIKPYIEKDPNVHSWFRWKEYEDYWQLLNDTKFLIYPGVRSRPQWDSQRPWEALAAGCLLMVDDPPVDMHQYPITGIAFTYQGLPLKVQYEPDKNYEDVRAAYAEMALRYFAPKSIARYFLHKIHTYGEW